MSDTMTNPTGTYGVPSYLETPPTSVVHPPVETQIQELPFEQLSWQDFEKLCLRLVRLRQFVEHAQQYGVQGEKQKGIDIYARHRSGGNYSTYQCKRVAEFGPSDISAAVAKFLEGDWALRSKEFVLCCSESMAPTRQADEIERQGSILKERGIDFPIWDRVVLSLMLKKQPEIVDDFFGRPWVDKFCDRNAAGTLNRRRLDAAEVREFRAALGQLYATVFNTYDPGLPSITGDGPNTLPLQQRYVWPDVEIEAEVGTVHAIQAVGEPQWAGMAGISQPSEALQHTGGQPLTPRRTWRTRQRRSFVTWLASSARSIVLGEPGGGKSTLLRFVAIDLLSDAPQLGELATRWGLHLPVWVPFGWWTKRVSEPVTQDSSLEDFLRSWLHNLNETRLWPIVEKALHDDRLLFLVDGLDEWKDEVAARTALGRLLVFVQRRQTPTILTSRPHGFERLQSLLPVDVWPRGELASWTPDQQKELASIWFRHRAAAFVENRITVSESNSEAISRRASTLTNDFMSELEQSVDLRQLAENPLLLSLLIAFKIHNAHLPSGRFEVYERTIRYLIETHPNHRRVAASLGSSEFDLKTDDVEALFAHLAYQMQCQDQFVAIGEREAQRQVEQFLRDERIGRMGFSAEKAHRVASSLLDLGEHATGLLTEKAPRAVGFFHRAFHEYLAAKHLSEMDFADQMQVVRMRCANPQWREVILSLFSQTRRSSEVSQLLNVLQEAAEQSSETNSYAITELLAEVVCGPFSCPVPLSRRIAQDLCRRIEFESWQPHRERLLHSIMDGLRSTRLKDVLQEQLRRWFPSYTDRRGYLYWAMRMWPRSPDVQVQVEACLWRGLHDEVAENARGAAKSYSEILADDAQAGTRLARLSLRAVEPLTRAAALEGLLRGWPSHPDAEYSADSARAALHSQLRLMGLKARVQQKRHTDEDRTVLLQLASEDGGLGYAREWENDIVTTLVDGWSGVGELKHECLSALQKDSLADASTRILSSTLLRAYPQDDEVVAFCLKDWEREVPRSFFRLDSNAWDLLRQNFRDHPDLVTAVDGIIEGEKRLRDVDLAFAALIGRTPVTKAQLLASLGDMASADHKVWIQWPIWSLLEGWGMEDPDVAIRLEEAMRGPARVVSGFAHLLPRIILDKAQCRERLLELLRDPTSQSFDSILSGLEKLSETQGDTPVVDIVLESAYRQRHRGILSHCEVLPSLLVNYSQDERVKQIARRQLDEPDGYYVAVTHAFGDDPAIRKRALEIASPLPVALRRLVVRRLCDGTGDSGFDTDLLERCSRDPDGEVKVVSAAGYYTRLKPKIDSSPELAYKVTNDLRRDLRKGTPVDFDSACAAYVGLMTLDRLETVAEFMSDSDYFHLLVEPPRVNTAFAHFLLANWSKHRKFMGDKIWSVHQLSALGSDYDQQRFWEAVAPLVDSYPEAREQMLQFVVSQDGHLHEDDILRFLARVRPASPLLLESCFWNLHMGYVGRIAGQIIGSQFAGDGEVLRRMTQHQLPWNTEPTLKDHFTEGEVIAVCEGWPEHPLIVRWMERLFNRPWKSEDRHKAGLLDLIGGFFAVICCQGSFHDVERALQRLLEMHPVLDPYDWAAPFVVRPIRRRLEIDTELANSLLLLLGQTTNPSEKATLPGLLHGIAEVSSQVERWCQDELNRQLSGTAVPDVGFDLLSNQLRPLAHVLLDLLEPPR